MTPPTFSLSQVEGIAKTISDRAEADAAERIAKRDAERVRAAVNGHNVSPAELFRIRAEAARTAYTASGKASVALLDAAQMRTALDTTTGVGLIVEDRTARVVATAQHPVRLPALVDFRIAQDLRVHASETTTYTGSAASAAEGAALPALTALLVPSSADIMLSRFGCTADFSRYHWEDAGVFARTVAALIEREFWRGLESDLINGSTGILASVTATPIGADTQIDALSKAVEAVQNAGHYGPLTAVLNPSTLNAIRRQKTSQGAYILDAGSPLEDVTLLPCAGVAAGTGIVGDFAAGQALWVHREGVMLELAGSNNSGFTDGTATARINSYLAHRVVQSSAFGVVTGL